MHRHLATNLAGRLLAGDPPERAADVTQRLLADLTNDQVDFNHVRAGTRRLLLRTLRRRSQPAAILHACDQAVALLRGQEADDTRGEPASPC